MQLTLLLLTAKANNEQNNSNFKILYEEIIMKQYTHLFYVRKRIHDYFNKIFKDYNQKT